MKNFLTLMFVAVALGGCATAGNKVIGETSSAAVEAKVIEGKTTMSEVSALYGPPTKKSFTDGGSEVWTYEYAYAKSKAINFVPIVGLVAGGVDVDKKELVILFDKQNVVQRRTFTETKTEVNRGVAPK